MDLSLKKLLSSTKDNFWQSRPHLGLEDLADRVNYLYTTMMLSFFVMIVFTLSYLTKPISCYLSNDPGGSNLLEYMENYCWAEGTYAIAPRAKLPERIDAWMKHGNTKIRYYQWVPLMLAFQCLMFYFPRYLWEIFCSRNNFSLNFQLIMKQAHDVSEAHDLETKDKALKNLCNNLSLLFSRTNKKSLSCKNYSLVDRFRHRRYGHYMILAYLFLKLLYLLNSFLQFYLLGIFLNGEYTLHMDERGSSIVERRQEYFAISVMRSIFLDADWHSTMVFPRVTYCHTVVDNLGVKNNVVGQCVLYMNMLYEKIFIFLWFWYIFVFASNFVSIPIWYVSTRKKFRGDCCFNNYLELKERDHVQNGSHVTVNHFIKEYLHSEGIFYIKMIALQVGDIIASNVMTLLWDVYTEMRSCDKSQSLPDIHKERVDTQNYGVTLYKPLDRQSLHLRDMSEAKERKHSDGGKTLDNGESKVLLT